MFHVGQKVVCVDDGPARSNGLPLPLRKGDIYTVSKFIPAGLPRTCGCIIPDDGLDVAEAPNPQDDHHELLYVATRFRPVHSIQIFRDIANGVKQPERENA